VELSDALHDVETFSHSVAHDLRSPLGAILNYAVALEESRSNLSDEDRRIIHRMRDAAQRSCHLLSGLLEFGSSGASPLQPQVVDVRAVVEGACAESGGGRAGAPEREVRDRPVAILVRRSTPGAPGVREPSRERAPSIRAAGPSARSRWEAQRVRLTPRSG
jgi:signal transduction histidine kinase